MRGRCSAPVPIHSLPVRGPAKEQRHRCNGFHQFFSSPAVVPLRRAAGEHRQLRAWRSRNPFRGKLHEYKRHAESTAPGAAGAGEGACRPMNIIGPMAISAFVVKVPSAEPLVGDLRERFDATTKLGVPAHITVLVPFMDPQHITPAVLERAQHALNEVAAFSFSLGMVARFPTTAYLAPEPPEPFTAMTRALVEVFPDFQPYGGEHQGLIPHLTVAHGEPFEADAAAAELQGRLDAGGIVEACCTSVVLIENSTGRWEELHVFQLPPAASV